MVLHDLRGFMTHNVVHIEFKLIHLILNSILITCLYLNCIFLALTGLTLIPFLKIEGLL